MRVLVIGGGGREHAIVWKVAQSPKVNRIYCAPGNAGIAAQAECVNIKATDIPALLQFAKDQEINLVIVGPESPLIIGIVDEFQAAGIPVFGPSKAAAVIEGSKVFAKELMAKYNIPTADFRIFDNADEAKAYIESISVGCECPIVVKADGEAAGKGVIVCSTKDEALTAIDSIMVKRIFGASGDRVTLEERLQGQEASLMAFTDGEYVVPMMPAQDHKPVYDGDFGPNTGGMGCYSPVPVVTPEVYDQVLETIIKPTVRAMKEEGRMYTGVLYTGIMLTADGPKVIEYNARLGDPETQVVLPMMDADLIEVMEACLARSLDSLQIRWYNGASVCVVMASGGYPGDYETGKPISGLEEAESVDGVTVFHAGTKLQDGQVVTSGGRVLGVTGMGGSIREAIDTAYRGVSKISFEGMHFRKDIGAKALRDA